MKEKTMRKAKTIKTVALAVFVSLSLTACDPPIPQELLVAQAELEILCEEGDTTVSLPEAIIDLGFTWSDAVAVGCDTMSLTPVEEIATDAGILLSEQSLIASRCTPFATVPIAIDAAVLVTNVPGYFEIYLSPDQIVDIFNGTITNWGDPALVVNNEEYPMPDLPIILPTEATASSKQAMSDWISRLAGEPLDLSAIADSSEFSESVFAMPFEEGAISIASVSAATFAGSSIVAIIPTSGDPDSMIRPDYEAILSAKTQLVSNLEGSLLTVSLDPSIEPTAEEGLTEVVPPYQAVYAVKMALCGEDTTLKRTAARFMLRQDSQGVIAASAMLPLTEKIRIEAIQIITVGLPSPTPLATDEG
jgi:phosphate transport system substrate-binding protein